MKALALLAFVLLPACSLAGSRSQRHISGDSLSSGSCQVVARSPSNSPLLNQALDRLITVLVSPSRRTWRSLRAPDAVIDGLDAILARLRPELEPRPLYQTTTARAIARPAALLQRLFGCSESPDVPAATRIRFIRYFLRTDSSLYRKLGALLMAVTPTTDLNADDVGLMAFYIQRLTPSDYEPLGLLTLFLIDRLSPAVLARGARHHVLLQFVDNVLLRLVPVHFLIDHQHRYDRLSCPGPILDRKPIRDALTVLLLRCPVPEVAMAVHRASVMLQPRPWAQLFLDGVLRLTPPLDELFPPDLDLVQHVLVEIGVRAYRPIQILLLVMMGEKFETCVMNQIPKTLLTDQLKTLVADLARWYAAHRATDAVPIMLSHLSTDDRIEIACRLLTLDRTHVPGEFWAQFWRLRFYGELHFYLMGCVDLRSLYERFDAHGMARIVLAVAAWNETHGPIPGDKLCRDQDPDLVDADLDVTVSDMVTGLLRGVRETHSIVTFAANRRRYELIELLIARCWTQFAEFEPLVQEAFAPGPAPIVADWVAALDADCDRRPFRSFYLFFQALTGADRAQLDDWRQALAARAASFAPDELARLRLLDDDHGQGPVRDWLKQASWTSADAVSEVDAGPKDNGYQSLPLIDL